MLRLSFTSIQFQLKSGGIKIAVISIEQKQTNISYLFHFKYKRVLEVKQLFFLIVPMNMDKLTKRLIPVDKHI